jgi:hypothetical protein
MSKWRQAISCSYPPYLPHLEANMSTTEELWWLACRTPENIVVNLADVDDTSLAGYRRA